MVCKGIKKYASIPKTAFYVSFSGAVSGNFHERDPASRQNDEKQGNGKNEKFLLISMFLVCCQFYPFDEITMNYPVTYNHLRRFYGYCKG